MWCVIICIVLTLHSFSEPCLLPTPALYGSHHHLSFLPSSSFFSSFAISLSLPPHRSFTNSVLASSILSLWLPVVILFGDVQPYSSRHPDREFRRRDKAPQLRSRPISSIALRRLFIEDSVPVPPTFKSRSGCCCCAVQRNSFYPTDSVLSTP